MVQKLFLYTSRHSSVLVLAIFLLVAATGCASKQPVHRDAATIVAGLEAKGTIVQEKGWWQAAIRIKQDKGAGDINNDTIWQVDLFLAHSVIAPILEKYHDDITLWRFHRRSAADASGHQFSFLFYSSPQVARQVFAEIADSTLLKDAKNHAFITAEIYDDTTKLAHPAICDTSDPNWSTITQNAWPYYIMGVSQMWLTMIDDIIKDNPPPAEALTSVNNLIDYYEEVNEVITALWRDEAQHAFLHHLNAIFGYEPMLYYDPRLIRF